MERNAVSTTISVALTAAFAATAMGQQITGTPGSPGATEIKHRYRTAVILIVSDKGRVASEKCRVSREEESDE